MTSHRSPPLRNEMVYSDDVTEEVGIINMPSIEDIIGFVRHSRA